MKQHKKQRFFLVKCKFGHVGRDKYLPLVVPLRARDAKEASSFAKRIRGIKKDHKDWCLEEPREVDEATFLAAKEAYHNDPYWDKHTRSNIKLFQDRLVDEANYTRHRGIKTNTVTFKRPTSTAIKKYHKRRSRVSDKEVAKALKHDDYDDM